MAKILSRYHIYQATSRLMVAPKLARPLTVTNFKNEDEGAVTASTVRGFSTATSDQIQMKDSFALSVGNPSLDLFLNIFKPYAYKGEDQTERREISEVAGKSRFVGNASFPHQVVRYGNHLHSGQVAGLRWNTMVEDLCLKQGQLSNCLSGSVKVFTRGIHQDVKLRKQQKGRMKGISSRGDHICFGTYALQALGRARISSKTLEAGRKMLKWGAGKGGKIWTRVFPDQSTTVRPIGTRMGRGKGSLGPPQDRVAIVKPGRIIYELSGVTEETAKRAILKGGHKMPVRTQFKLSTTSLKVPLQEMRCLWQSKKRRRVQTEEMISELYGPTLQFMVSLIADDYLAPTSEDCKMI